MNPHIFREYDIRYQLGLSFGTYYHSQGAAKIALGRDCRLSSPELRDSLLNGLVESGVDVLDVGMVPTPLLYFALHHFEVDGGIQITGSHNRELSCREWGSGSV
jgi:phosphomannomutase/phosphoglucomutase